LHYARHRRRLREQQLLDTENPRAREGQEF
jgi:hypothetical protein